MGEPIATVGDLAGICGHDGTDWIKALIDAAGHLQIDVVDSGGADLKDLLDKLDECLIALQLIDDLRTALDSVGTDELDVNVEGFDPVPSSSVHSFPATVAVGTATWTTAGSYTVTTGKTFYLTDFYITYSHDTTGVESLGRVKIGGATVIELHTAAGHGLAEHLNTPLKATSGQVVAFDVYHAAGAERYYQVTVIGFEV